MGLKHREKIKQLNIYIYIFISRVRIKMIQEWDYKMG